MATMSLFANSVILLLATHHAVLSQKNDYVVVKELINELETKFKQEMAQLEERLISKFILTMEKQDTTNQVNIVSFFQYHLATV